MDNAVALCNDLRRLAWRGEGVEQRRGAVRPSWKPGPPKTFTHPESSDSNANQGASPHPYLRSDGRTAKITTDPQTRPRCGAFDSLAPSLRP